MRAIVSKAAPPPTLEGAATDPNILASYPASFVARKKHHDIGNVFRLANSVERRHRCCSIRVPILHHVRPGETAFAVMFFLLSSQARHRTNCSAAALLPR